MRMTVPSALSVRARRRRSEVIGSRPMVPATRDRGMARSASLPRGEPRRRGPGAGPLLVASLTDDAFYVALAATLQWLPPLLFGLYAGALSDRLDRKVIVVAA